MKLPKTLGALGFDVQGTLDHSLADLNIASFDILSLDITPSRSPFLLTHFDTSLCHTPLNLSHLCSTCLTNSYLFSTLLKSSRFSQIFSNILTSYELFLTLPKGASQLRSPLLHPPPVGTPLLNSSPLLSSLTLNSSQLFSPLFNSSPCF